MRPSSHPPLTWLAPSQAARGTLAPRRWLLEGEAAPVSETPAPVAVAEAKAEPVPAEEKTKEEPVPEEVLRCVINA